MERWFLSKRYWLESDKKLIMRIISGFLKGKSIKYLKNLKTRPLKDVVKENLFNIIQHSNQLNININDAKILDLYSGVGSFGIECISRGAKKVVFIEADKKAANILKENLIQHSILDKTRIINNKIEDTLVNLKNEKFSIFFLDPPYADNKYVENLNLIKKYKIIEQNHLVIIHRETKSSDTIDKLLNIVFVKKYGRAKLIFALFT